MASRGPRFGETGDTRIVRMSPWSERIIRMYLLSDGQTILLLQSPNIVAKS
jgi:hypothetical protein